MADDAESDALDRASYVRALLDETRWTRLAQGLRNAAAALKPQVKEVWDSWSAHARDKSGPLISDAPLHIQMMLYAFAVENLMKALLVRHKRDEYLQKLDAASKPTLPDELRTHDLVDLAAKIRRATKREEQIDSDRQEFIRRLTRRAQWYGRYPVPVRCEQMSGLQRSPDGKLHSESYVQSSDANEAECLIGELCRDLGLH